MTELKTEKRIPPAIKRTVFQAFVESISEEILELRKHIGWEKTSFFNVDTMAYERLIAISETFGVPFSTIVRNDIEFLRQEVKNIGFKLFYKGTPTLYKSFFASIDRIGQVFIYIYSSASDQLFRSIKIPMDSARVTDKNLPFLFESKNDYSGKIENWLTLDDGLIIDNSPVWRLDTSNSLMSSNHIGFEYFIDRIIERKGKEYLMTNEYLMYIMENVEWGRRCKEVPHVGSQLSIQTDLSGLTNKNFPGAEYSVPSLKLNVVGNPQLLNKIASKYDLVTAKFGIGTQVLPSTQNPSIPFPTDLNYPIAEAAIMTSDIWEDSTYIGATCEYIGQEVKRIKIPFTFNGTDTHFEFTLPMAPIRRGNVCIAVKNELNQELYETLDDRRGIFSSKFMQGTIDYETGHCVLDTKFDYRVNNTFLEKECVKPNDKDLWEFEIEVPTPAIKGSVELNYTIKNKAYKVFDKKDGTFESPDGSIVASEINYTTGKVSVRFVSPLQEDLFVKWSYHVNWVPNGNNTLYASYFFVLNTIDITEFGLYNPDGVLLAYATFPPLEFSSTNFHCNFTILVDKTIT